MYVELMKNFLLADSSELMVLRLISASWEKKRLIPTFLTWYTSSWRKIFFSPIRASWWLLDSFRPPEPKTFDSYFLDIMYVELLKNFLLADSSHLMVLRLISVSWEKKRLIPTFLTWYTSSCRKIFFSPIRASWWLLDSFRPPEPKTFDSYFLDIMYVELLKNFLLADSSHLMVLRLISVSWEKKRLIPTFLTWYTSSCRKIFFSPIRANLWLLYSFRPPEPINVDSFFLDKVYVECMKNFLLADSSELMVVRLISASWAKKRLIPTF